MADVHVPAGWPEAVAPPGMEGWEASAIEFPVKFICSAGSANVEFIDRARRGEQDHMTDWVTVGSETG